MEQLTTEQLEELAANFDSIKDCYEADDKELMLSKFQEQLKKVFSGVFSESLLVKCKLQMWRYNWEVLLPYLTSCIPDLVCILQPIFENTYEIGQSIFKNYEKLKSQNETVHTELAIKQEEINTILLASESLEQKINLLTTTNEQIMQELQQTQDELASALDMLQRENQTFLHKIISLSKQTAENSIPQSPIKTFRKEITPKIPNNTILMNNRIAQGRELGFKQLKETIEEVYATKVKFDEKCKESGLPTETMDQFMYTYLNQKFGLKTIITEWTFAIMKAVSRYENEDAEVKLFSKIIKHEVNEDFRYVLWKVKERIKQLLKIKITNSTAYMRESQLANVLKEKIQGKIDESEWASIISSMYTQEEAEYMGELVRQLILKKTSPNKSKTSTSEISFADLQNIILNYDLTSHETLLAPFVDYFKKFDQDHDGLLLPEEFQELCKDLKISEKFEGLLEKVDPLNLRKISFSMCVGVFSEEKRTEAKDSLSVLHDLFFSTQESQQ